MELLHFLWNLTPHRRRFIGMVRDAMVHPERGDGYDVGGGTAIRRLPGEARKPLRTAGVAWLMTEFALNH